MKLPTYLALALLPSLALADTPLTYNRVDFHSEVSRELSNDQLNATLSLELSDKDPAKLARELTQAMNEALRQARAYPGVKASTGPQQTWPLYGKGLASSSKLEGWRGRAELRLESQDFQATAELIAQLQSRLQLGGLHFSVAPATRQALESSLSTEAIAKFRQQADTIRQAWQAKSYRLVHMNLGSAGAAPQFRGLMMSKMADAEAAPVAEYAPGDSRMTVTVSGTIELQP